MSADPILEDLTNLARKSPIHVLGLVAFDEEKFFVATSKLKRWVGEQRPAMQKGKADDSLRQQLAVVDELESIVRTGKLRLAGHVLVKEQNYQAKLGSVRTAIASDYFDSSGGWR